MTADRQPGKEFGGLSPQEAGRKGAAARRAKRDDESGPVITEAHTDAIVRALRDRAKTGDHMAARELREWIEVRRETEGRAKDQRLIELLSPELREAIAEELYGRELPASWPHERLEVSQ
jgi:hypothetical protein